MARVSGRFENPPRTADTFLDGSACTPPKAQVTREKEQHLKNFLWVSTVLSTAILAACGGGGSVRRTGCGPPARLRLATSRPPARRSPTKTVEAKCSSGTGTATSNANGSYRISVTGGLCPAS